VRACVRVCTCVSTRVCVHMRAKVCVLCMHCALRERLCMQVGVQCLCTRMQCLCTRMQCLCTCMQCLCTRMQCLCTPMQCLCTCMQCLCTCMQWQTPLHGLSAKDGRHTKHACAQVMDTAVHARACSPCAWGVRLYLGKDPEGPHTPSTQIHAELCTPQLGSTHSCIAAWKEGQILCVPTHMHMHTCTHTHMD